MIPPVNSYLQINKPDQSAYQVDNTTVHHHNNSEIRIKIANNTSQDIKITQGQCIAYAMHQKVTNLDLNVIHKHITTSTRKSTFVVV